LRNSTRIIRAPFYSQSAYYKCVTSSLPDTNYRAACRGLSTADVLAKLGDVEEEADESLYWMELLAESGTVSEGRMACEMKEMDEILRMTVASIKTLRLRLRQSKIQNPQSKME